MARLNNKTNTTMKKLPIILTLILAIAAFMSCGGGGGATTTATDGNDNVKPVENVIMNSTSYNFLTGHKAVGKQTFDLPDRPLIEFSRLKVGYFERGGETFQEVE